MSKELSTEWQQKIKFKSTAYAYSWKKVNGKMKGTINGHFAADYSDCASLLIEAQERVKDLENSMRNIIRAIGAADYLGAKRIANESLSPVNPKKKEDE